MNLAKTLLMVITIVTFQVSAETVYRAVDDKGNVTFSDKPVSSAAQEERIRINAPVPSAERQEETQQREAELQKAASQIGTSSLQSLADQKKAARQNVRDAEKQLEEARRIRDGDRKGTASGGSRLTTEYQERVRAAEADVDRARQQLKQMR